MLLADSLIVPQCVFRPGSFTGLMTLYESNYIRLKHLAELEYRTGSCLVSQVEGNCDLHAEVKSREAYTTTLKLTYRFAEPDGSYVADPDLVIRVYHDAKLVEAVSGAERHRHHKLKEWAATHTAELGRRWQRNLMLNKWLEYLTDLGHGF